MKIVINPLYDHFADFIKSLPDHFSKEGTTVYDERNTIKVFHVQGMELVVKSFKVPHFINKIVYAHFRSSKAERSYLNGLKLLEKGIETPSPVAYIEMKKSGLFYTSYFISCKSRFQRDFREISDLPKTDETDSILTDFALFTAQLHNLEILHKDYTPGNIRFGKIEGQNQYSFELIDINRMKFCPVSMKIACKNLDSLCIEDDMYRLVARKYAEARGFNIAECERLMLKYRDPDA